MINHVFETSILGVEEKHYSFESAVKRLLGDIPAEHWFWNLLRQSIKNLSLGETFILFNGTCSVKRVGYGLNESELQLFVYHIDEE